jgi:predicted DsbA family dithiol-disulfide isomerase
VRVDVWSDVVCPWCYIGKRRLEAALEGLPPIEVVWHSFELDPNAASHSDLTLDQLLAQKYRLPPAQVAEMQERVTLLAAQEGLEYHLESARPENTFDAHRLLHWAASHGEGPRLKERLLRAYFVEGERLGDHASLARLAGDIGLDPAAAAAVLADRQAFAAAVRADEQQARAYGISGVPFFVIDGRYGVSGAQASAVLRNALQRALGESSLG